MNTEFVAKQRRNWKMAEEEQARRSYHLRVAEENKRKAEAATVALHEKVTEFLGQLKDINQISVKVTSTSIAVSFGEM